MTLAWFWTLSCSSSLYILPYLCHLELQPAGALHRRGTSTVFPCQRHHGPKELHAHLNGSVSFQTMEKLIKRKPHLNIEHHMTAIDKGQRRTLDECFQVFKVIHQLVDTEEDILMVATDVIKEFAADGVKYLELRSTPREEKKTGLTKKNYVDTVIKAIQQCKEEVDIDVRFLVAIDRRNGTEVAMETVKLAEEFMLSADGLVVGLDLSGDPTVGHGRDLLPALQRAKNSGLKLSLHLSEVPSQLEESELLLNLPPDRIGHGTFLHPDAGGSQSLVDQVVKNNIPLELCLTSNVKGQTVPCYAEHHFKYWYQLGHPSVICTDDKGVFSTDLSQEYQLAASTFGLDREAVWTLSQQAIDFIFAEEAVKQQLKHKWTQIQPHVLK
ncbi:adenosine deaminase-like protein isoform X2 [Syngnathus typhle]|uniref:adenosine deaminase-like protein isoform X2 n=1 Tax=Syngnathus typhle TaxID=161592 RepID=UPI002A69E6C5|nr:adenosine deaminase-like protein isoform X2 [Syngnathus typhle]